MSWLFGGRSTSIPYPVPADAALPGSREPRYVVPDRHLVLGTPLLGPWPGDTAVIYLGMGCFWGAERLMWRLPGVVGTAAGYMGGATPNPTYEEVCTGRTGHAEVVMVAYDRSATDDEAILRTFWEHHDPTQGLRQGNDVGSQYRSAIFWTEEVQRRVVADTLARFEAALAEAGLGPITTEVEPAAGRTFYPAEGYHQQYLERNPHGYDCHARTGVNLPNSNDQKGHPVWRYTES